MNYRHRYRILLTYLASIILFLALSGCGNDDSRTSPQDKNTAEPQSSAVTKKTEPEPERDAEAETQSEPLSSQATLPAAIQNQVRLIREPSGPQLKLDISTTHLQSMQKQKVDLLHQPEAQKLAPAKKADKKLEIRGGIITDPEAADLRESVDGAEVKLDLKWD